MMSKLLVNAPNGLQELVEVQDGGGYFDPTLVIWDERTDGPLSPITLGGMKRIGNSLEFDQQLLDAHNSALASQVVPAPTKEQLMAELAALTAKIQALE